MNVENPNEFKTRAFNTDNKKSNLCKAQTPLPSVKEAITLTTVKLNNLIAEKQLYSMGSMLREHLMFSGTF